MTDQIARNFEKYDAEHPQVWGFFRYFTMQLISAGHKHGSAKMVFERIRWETAVTTGQKVKCNNNYTAMYARKFAEKVPEHSDFFRYRARSNDARDTINLGVEVHP